MLRLYDKSLWTALFLCFAFGLKAQDPVFSQYFLNLNYLNPAFAGYTNDLTTNFNSRVQYFGVPGVMASNTASANISCEEETRLGIGLLAYHNVEGQGILQTTTLSGQLSANFPFTIRRRQRTNKGLFSAGLQFGAGQKYLSWRNLSFSDQYTPYLRGVQNPTSIAVQQSSSNVFLDLGAGLRSTYEFGSGRKPKFISLGAAAFHLNRPAQSFLESNLKLEPRYTFYVFYYMGNPKKGRTKDLRYLSFGALADYQQGLQTHTLSVFKDLNEYMTVGLSVRREDFLFLDRRADAVIPHFVIKMNNLSVGVSYDWTLSPLGEENTFGSAEIGVSWRFPGRNLCPGYRKLCAVKGFDMTHDMPNLFF
ncbi:MAG: PorP/SprF family type IX secretion system membrane protein [Bacteroidetes bacterium]|nr:PorP/SprF family type IX secretion system membrane protein [Bacteroidota bacterium]